ncbi:MAG: S8 family serine peptidase [Caldilineaceae bacterium]|nr:S8 family serine peptidase [Caldilineaceae bacterium]
MQKILLNWLLVSAMVISAVTPALAQDQTPESPDDHNKVYLPAISIGGSGAFIAPEDDDDAPAVTVLEIPTSEFQQVAASARPGRAVPSYVEALKLDASLSAENMAVMRKLSPSLNGSGQADVVVRLSEPSVAELVAQSAEASSAAAQSAQRGAVRQQQAAIIGRLNELDGGASLLGTAQVALNAVMVNANLDALRELAKDPAVISIKPVVNYELDLSETVPYIGATAVQDLGFDGTGVKVAVLDSGVDYTHVALGGPGTLAAYEAAYGTSPSDPANTTRDGLFPTDKVKEGYDFVGEVWPNGPLAPDEDPIDFDGHGTHVSDIIAGVGGVAPGASLYGVKVCSAVSTSCSGVALIQGMDWVLDPNGDGSMDDRMDIVNMSLGSPYGQAYDDDLSQAVENATAAGILTVASAGNSSDKPFVVGSPSAAPSALSVAQTNVPSAIQPLMQVVSPLSIAGDYAAVFQPWSVEPAAAIEAPLQYGNGAGGNLLGCNPYPAGSLSGKIVLVDRGACAFSVKISNIGDAGGLVGIIGLVAPGDPFQGGFGGGNPTIPGYMISQADSNTLKSELATGVVVRFDPATGIPLVQHMVGSSSRGPTMGCFSDLRPFFSDNESCEPYSHVIKPEIGAPGASVSAVAGSGTGTEPFGGTSGAAPMVSGAAALLKQAYPDRSAYELKAVLVNTGETDIMNAPAFFGGDLAPITRIGGGEVRVDRALASPVAAWTVDTASPVISFGFDDWSTKNIFMREGVVIRNYTDQGRSFHIDVSFRFADDEANGAVKVTAPSSVFVSGNGYGNFGVDLHLDPTKLPAWTLNSGSQGANADLLTTLEFDGYVTLTDMHDPSVQIHLPWQILPRAAGNVSLKWTKGSTIEVKNRGVGTTTVESYSLLASNGILPPGGPGEQSPTPDFRYFGYATYPVPAGFCGPSDSFVMAFAVNTFRRQTHAVAPLSTEVDIDLDQNGTIDYAVFNADLSYPGISDGRNVTWVLNVATGSATAFFFTDHDVKSGNTVLLFCGDQIGLDASDFFDPMDIVALAVENYFQGIVTDFFDGITISPLGEQYLGVFANGGVGTTTLAYKEADKLTILDFGPLTNNTEQGLLLLYRGGAIDWVEAAVIYGK